jgi:2-polyprenyl-6-methoxyphenol hydroxylase-like FAD-dependent oxidoreductase
VLLPSDAGLLAGGGMLVLPDPASATPTRGGYLTPIEHGLWIAGLGGRSGDYPPTDPAAWLEFGRTLATPEWAELVGTAGIVDGPRAFRYPSSVRRQFGRLHRFPSGLLVLGDAVSHANPLYGHGMSAAAGQAHVFDQVLEDRDRRGLDLGGTAPEFFAGAQEVTRAPWAMAAGSDFLSAGTTGDFPADEMENLLRLVELSTLVDSDADAASLFVDVFSLRRPWSTLETSPWRDRLTPQTAHSPAR